MSKCKIHFLNVLNGDCTIIEHETGRISVIDICNGNCSEEEDEKENSNKKNKPTNPIDYLWDICAGKSIFRFILTHPDMDHMDGIKNLFDNFHPINFWDTNHEKDLSKADFKNYDKNDWEFYKEVRKIQENPKVLQVYEGYQFDFYRLGLDNFEIISPSKKLVEELKKTDKPDWNEISYVILHNVYNRKILYCGDSGNKAWKNIMEDGNLLNKIRDIDILLAPHHGRKTGGDDMNEYLDILEPKLAIFGNTEKSEYKAYKTFYDKDIPILTNSEVSDIIDIVKDDGNISLKITRNTWDKLIKTKNKDWEKLLNENKIYLKK